MCGIYIIQNTINNMVYVGKSVNIAKRFRAHKRLLNLGTHHNAHLQKSWNKYSETAFDFKIIDVCDRDDLSDLEIYYIDMYSKNSGVYNLTDGGDGTLGNRKSNYTKALIGAKNSHKVVLLNTREVFNSYVEASSIHSLSPSIISMACTGRIKSAGRTNGVALAWATYDDYIDMTEEEISERISKAQTGLKYDITPVVLLNTNERFESVAEATQKYNISNISACCRHIRKSCGTMNGKNLVWMFASEYDTLSEEQIHKAICDGQKVEPLKVVLLNTGQIYDSIEIASQILGVSDTAIRSNCLGKRKSGGEYNGIKLAWMYEDEYNTASKDKIDAKLSESKNSRHQQTKCIRLVNTDEIFKSINNASAIHHLSRRGITKCCDGVIDSYGQLNGVPMVWEYC